MPLRDDEAWPDACEKYKLRMIVYRVVGWFYSGINNWMICARFKQCNLFLFAGCFENFNFEN